MRVVSLDAFAVGQNGFQDGKRVKAVIAFEVRARGVERPKILPAEGAASLGVMLAHVRIKKKQNARALTVQRINMHAVVLVDRPKVKSAFLGRVSSAAEERPD